MSTTDKPGVKPGVKTSEALISGIATAFAGWLMAQQNADGTTHLADHVQIALIVSVSAIIISYVWSRAYVKGRRASRSPPTL